MTTLSIAEVVAAIQAATQPSDDGYATTEEIRAVMGCSAITARQRLALLLKAGQLAVGKVTRAALDGRLQRVPGYKVVPLKARAR